MQPRSMDLKGRRNGDFVLGIIFQMGQNSSKKEWGHYSSREFFGKQVELYRWRADPLVNTHICRVSFQPQAQLTDRQRLQNFLQADQIALKELMALTDSAGDSDQLISFEQYLCTLSQLTQRLALPQVLYVLQALFSGYENLLVKLGRCRAELGHCFVTAEGEVRTWISSDFRSNEADEEGGLSSEMGLMRRILELGEQLASNHTEFLHFSRQFRSCMERDILQNWNFAHARKLINSYVYTHRINIPPNIKEALLKAKSSLVQSQATSAFQSQSNPNHSQRFFTEPKPEIVTISSGFQRDANQQKKETQRPLSHSEYSNSTKKSQNIVEHILKSHSKKNSSSELKKPSERSKAFESPKISRSELIANNGKEADDEKIGMQYSSMQSQRVKRERDFTRIGDSQETKFYNFSTTVGLSPDTNSLLPGQDAISKVQPNQSILKHNQQAKDRRRLEKKVATISRYISYYQHESHTSRQSDIVKESSSNTHYNVVFTPPFQDQQNHPPSIASNKGQPKMTHKFSCDITNIHTGREKRMTEVNCSHKGIHKSDSSSDDNTYPRACITINKLIENNEVSLHESNGSFMSMEQTHSDYSGVLCKMGRSVDMINIPSRKEFIQQKMPNTTNNMNKSIDC